MRDDTDTRDGFMNLSVVVLTFNEEANIEACLYSVVGWAQEVFVVDSFSTDSTLEISASLGAKVYQHEWKHIADQRNWALSNLPLDKEWVLFVDADERLSPEVREEIEDMVAGAGANVAAVALRQEFYFLGRPLRHVHTGSAQIRLVRRDRAVWERTEGTDERCVARGTIKILTNRLIHLDRKGLSGWIAKHNWYATERAKDIVAGKKVSMAFGREQHTEINIHWHARLKWLLRQRFPTALRPFAYFVYTFFFRLGFLDGAAGFAYAFLHELWFYLLVNWKVREMRAEIVTRSMEKSEKNRKALK